MIRRASKVDANHSEIVAAFRQMSCSVQDLSRVGEGCPDLLVGFRGAHGEICVAVEVKDGSRPPSGRKLNARQMIWFNSWQGAAEVVESVEQVAELVNSYRRGSRAKGRTTLSLPVGSGGS